MKNTQKFITEYVANISIAGTVRNFNVRAHNINSASRKIIKLVTNEFSQADVNTSIINSFRPVGRVEL